MPPTQALSNIPVADGIRLKDASAEVAAATGLSSRDLYQAVLASR